MWERVASPYHPHPLPVQPSWASSAGLCQLVWCVNPACPEYAHLLSPEAERQIALPRWRMGWDVVLWMGFRRFCRHWSIPQIQAELSDTYQIRLSVKMLTAYARKYQTMVAARHQDVSLLRATYAEIADVILTIDGIQPEKGHETVYVVRELRQQRVWFAESLLSSATEEIQRLVRRVRLLTDQIGKPVCGWMSDKQEAFVTAIAAEFPDTPHRYCANHFLRDAAAQMLDVDSHAKVQMRRKGRGLRALERAALQILTQPTEDYRGVTPEQQQHTIQVVLSYCAAVRGILNDTHGGPLWPAGWRMAQALREVCRSLERNLACPSTPIASLLERLYGYIQRGLARYEQDLGRIGAALGDVLLVWTILHPAPPETRQSYRAYFHRLAGQFMLADDPLIQHIGQTMQHFEEGLFCGGDALDLPDDNLDLERWIKGPKGHERRIHGRKHVGLRMVAEAPTLLLAWDAHLSHKTPFTVQELLPYADAEVPESQQQAVARHQMMRKVRSKKTKNRLRAARKGLSTGGIVVFGIGMANLSAL